MTTEQILDKMALPLLWTGGAVLLLIVAFLVVALYSKLKAPKTKEAHWFSNALTTGPGMLLALLVGTLFAVTIGIFLTAVYKYLGIDDSFGQGSGSLIQAIWGSAATISASVVAIMLALEAIKQAKTTNATDERVARLEEYGSPVFIQLESVDAVRRDLDWYALSMRPLLSRFNGEVQAANAGAFLLATNKVIDGFERICQSSLFVALNEMPLQTLTNQRNSAAVNLQVAPAFTQTYGGLLNQNYLFAMDLRSMLQHASGNTDQIAHLLNSKGRSFWAYLYTVRTLLDHIGIAYIEQFMAYRMNPTLEIPSLSSALPQPNACPAALDILAELATLLNARKT